MKCIHSNCTVKQKCLVINLLALSLIIIIIKKYLLYSTDVEVITVILILKQRIYLYILPLIINT